MPKLSQNNKAMLEDLIYTYNALSWYSKLDLPKELAKAIKESKRCTLNNAFLICFAHIEHTWYFQGLLSNPLRRFTKDRARNNFLFLEVL